MRYAICYISTASEDLGEKDIRELLEFTEGENNHQDIKGILLYSEGNFFQALEGEKEIVMNLYEQIQKDPRHHNIIQVVGKDIFTGSFDGYQTDIVTESNKYDPGIFKDYLEPLKGMDQQTRQAIKDLLEVFIETRK